MLDVDALVDLLHAPVAKSLHKSPRFLTGRLNQETGLLDLLNQRVTNIRIAVIEIKYYKSRHLRSLAFSLLKYVTKCTSRTMLKNFRYFFS